MLGKEGFSGYSKQLIRSKLLKETGRIANDKANEQEKLLEEQRRIKETLLQESIKDSQSSQEVYLKLLGLERYPEAARDLPHDVYLPSDLVSSVAQTISLAYEGSNEKTQIIGWNKKKGGYRFSNIIEGNSDDGGFIGALSYGIKTAFFTQRPLLHFHSHPGGEFFSIQDISAMTYRSKPPYIALVGGGEANRIYALLLTKQFDSHKSKVRRHIWEGYALSGYFNNRNIERYGLGVYRGHLTSRPEDSKSGIVLEKRLTESFH